MNAIFTANNSAPVAVDDRYDVKKGQTLKVDAKHGLLANDTDAENDPLTVTSVTLVDGKGKLDWKADGSFEFTPDPDFSGPIKLDYTVSDGQAHKPDENTPVTKIGDESESEYSVIRSFDLPDGRSARVEVGYTQIVAWLREADGTETKEVVEFGNGGSDLRVERMPNGNFIVVWKEIDGWGSSSSENLHASIFDANLKELVHDTKITDYELFDGTNRYTDSLRLTVLADGSVVMTWVAKDLIPDPDDSWSATGYTNVSFLRFDAKGNPLGSPDILLPDADFYSVTSLTNGNFVAAWEAGDSELGRVIYARIFDSTGHPTGPALLLKSDPSGTADIPMVTSLSNGGFVMMWRVWHGWESADLSDVKAQIFDEDGKKIGEEFFVHTGTAGLQHPRSIVALSNGGFAIIWNDDDAGMIKAQIFDSQGHKVGAEILVTNAGEGSNYFDIVAKPLANGDFSVTWYHGASQSFKTQVFHLSNEETKGHASVDVQDTGVTINDDDAGHLLNGTTYDDEIHGNGGNDTIYGFEGNDVLDGGAGDDRLEGGSGNNTLTGGAGDDTIISKGTDTVDGGDGTDSWAGDYSDSEKALSVTVTRDGTTVSNGTTVKNVENIGVTGGKGDDSFKVTGNLDVSFSGGAGTDSVTVDHSALRDGRYYAIYDSGGSFQLSSGNLSAYGVEKVSLTAGAGDDTIELTPGNSPAEDALTIDAGAGNDRLRLNIQGFDKSLTFKLSDDGTVGSNAGRFKNFESFDLRLGDNGSDIVLGDDSDRVEAGKGTNRISTGAGDDTIISKGTDTVDGGDGTDSWAGDYSDSEKALSVTVTRDGTTVSNGTTVKNVENIGVTGGKGDDSFKVTGNLDVSFSGGAGTDSVTVDHSALRDGRYYAIYDSGGSFQLSSGNLSAYGVEKVSLTAGSGDDTIELTPGNSPAEDALTIDAGAGNDRLRLNIQGFDKSLTFKLSDDGTVSSNAGRFKNFESFDLRLGDNGSDIVLGDGSDRVEAGKGTNRISTGAGDDTIISQGIDTIDGGDGDDVYRHFGKSADYKIERDGRGGYIITDINLANGDEGVDHVVHVEHIQFDDKTVDLPAYDVDVTIMGTEKSETLTGTASDDTIYGLGGDDKLYGMGGKDLLDGGNGNDYLDGGDGADTMRGGKGNDTYVVDNQGDIVDETGGDGIDTVISSISYSLKTMTTPANAVENLTLTGKENLEGVGNDLSNTITGNDGDNRLNGLGGDDTLIGGAGNDVLIGGGGKDIMRGGSGDDTYDVDMWGDVVDELDANGKDSGGIDTVRSNHSFSLMESADVKGIFENLRLTGSQNISGNGNALDNRIEGNDGNNRLNGGLGNDTLIGGKGADTFVFNTALGKQNVDVIIDFQVGVDRIELNNSIFGKLVDGTLKSSEFLSYTRGGATTANQHILYNSNTGKLYYDEDGSGSKEAVLFAQLQKGLDLHAWDFVVV